MNNDDLKKIIETLNQMDKKDLESALQKASNILNSKGLLKDSSQKFPHN